MELNPRDVTGIIFAGGKSSRMGFDKALALYKGQPMISYSIELLKPFCNRILISSSNTLHKDLGYECISDEYQDTGPIGGLSSCLHQSSTEVNICLPCDVPEMKPAVIRHLLSAYDYSSCIVPLTPLPEPLIAVYPKAVKGVVKQMISEGKYQMTGIFARFPVKYVELNEFNLQHAKHSFANINKPSDLGLE